MYAAAVAEAVARIRAGGLEKVVLARSLVAPNPGIDLRALLAELRRRDPGCHLFAAPADGGAFVGVTPETLVRREGERVLSLPHAGTAARSPDPGEDRRAAEGLLRSAKDRHEHRPVVEAVADALAPHCSELHVDPSRTSPPPPPSGTSPPRSAGACARRRRARSPWLRRSIPRRRSAGPRRPRPATSSPGSSRVPAGSSRGWWGGSTAAATANGR